MRILLVRHGKPAGVRTPPISGRSIREWVSAYDAAGVRAGAEPPAQLRQRAAAARCIVASDLPRATTSGVLLAGARSVMVDADLREAPLPSLPLSLKLPPGMWIVIARLAWLANLGAASETSSAVRARASRMADRLAALAAEHECVLAVGHGMFNRFLGGELRRRGWRGPRFMPHAYWGVAQFELAGLSEKQG